MKPVGTCGECGGPVCFPEMWGGTQLPPATCQNCGRNAKQFHGPIMQMEPKRKVDPLELFKRKEPNE